MADFAIAAYLEFQNYAIEKGIPVDAKIFIGFQGLAKRICAHQGMTFENCHTMLAFRAVRLLMEYGLIVKIKPGFPGRKIRIANCYGLVFPVPPVPDD
ncbi:MAG: hypothetical protein ABIA63_03030 [bacterium]